MDHFEEEKAKSKVIELRIEGLKVSSDWWTQEFADLICEICDDRETSRCNKMTCQIANPWCG